MLVNDIFKKETSRDIAETISGSSTETVQDEEDASALAVDHSYI